MDPDIISYARQVHNMLIGERTAEEVKIEAGSAFPLERELSVELKGRDLATGLPKSVEVSSVEMRDALVRVRQRNHRLGPSDHRDHASGAGGRHYEHRHHPRRRRRAPPRPRPPALAGDHASPSTSPKTPLTCVVRGAAEVLEEAAILQKLQARLNTRKAPR